MHEAHNAGKNQLLSDVESVFITSGFEAEKWKQQIETANRNSKYLHFRGLYVCDTVVDIIYVFHFLENSLLNSCLAVFHLTIN